MFVSPPQPPAPPAEPPEALRPVTSVPEALAAFDAVGAGQDARDFLEGKPNRSPRWAVRDPRTSSALSVLLAARAEATPPPPAPPACEPVQAPHPSRVASFGDLIARGLAATEAFAKQYPADYARLKREQAQRLAHPHK